MDRFPQVAGRVEHVQDFHARSLAEGRGGSVHRDAWPSISSTQGCWWSGSRWRASACNQGKTTSTGRGGARPRPRRQPPATPRTLASAGGRADALRIGPGDRRIAKQRLDHRLGGAGMRLDLISRAEHGHLLRSGFGREHDRGRRWPGRRPACAAGPLAVGMSTRLLARGRRRAAGWPRSRRPPRPRSGSSFQTGHGLLQAQDAPQQGVNLAVGILHDQGLIESRSRTSTDLRQSQPGIERRASIAGLPRAVDHLLQEEVPKID